LADKKKEIYDGDLEALINGFLHGSFTGTWELVSLNASTGTDQTATAEVSLKQRAGRVALATAAGDGPVGAVFKGIDRVTELPLRLRDYQVSSASLGGDAQGEVSVEVEHQGRTYRGHGVDTDIILASAHAYLEVINRAAANGRSSGAPALRPASSAP